ncbi:MAG: carbohydrate porin [Xanthobacteraceae bacterium]
MACASLAWACLSNCLPTIAWGQAIRSDNPAPAGQSYLTGDWGGLRSYLESHGITFTFSNTTDLLANVNGGIKTGAVGLGAFQPQLDLDLQKLAGLEGDRVHIHGLVTYGPLFSANYLGNILAVSNIEAGPMARLYAFWYEHNAPDNVWSIRFGLMLADSQFLQSDTAANFINNGISWPTFLAANLPASGPAYPLPAPGIRVRVQPRDNLQFQAAVFSGDPSGGIGSNQPAPLPNGTVFSLSGGAFFIAEASYLPNQSKDASGLPGAYRIGAWYHTSTNFADQRFDNTGVSLASPQSTGVPEEHAGDSGVYGVIDQMLYRVPGTNDQGLSGFARAGGVPNDRNLINFYADGGLAYKGLVPGRPDDKVGIAVAYARVGDNARGLDADIGLFGNFFYPVRSSETVIEMMYKAQLAPWWVLQPDLQYVFNPGGGVLNSDGSLRSNALVVGVRTIVNF